jgi:hypothetical protein
MTAMTEAGSDDRRLCPHAAQISAFKRRLADALAVAREQGFVHVRITTPDGAAYEFEVDPADPAPTGEEERNEIDIILTNRRKQQREAKP